MILIIREANYRKNIAYEIKITYEILRAAVGLLLEYFTKVLLEISISL